jgi:hypothetical protein
MSSPNGWNEYKVHIVHELERTNKELTFIDRRLAKIEKKLTILDTKIYVASFFFSVVFAGVFNLILGKF